MLFDHGKEKIGWLFIKCVHMYHFHYSLLIPKFGTVSMKLPSFNICVDFDLRDSKTNGEHKDSK